MKKEDLFQALNDTDDSFLDENAEIRHSSGWLTAVLSLAACAVISAGLIYFVPKPAQNSAFQPEEEIQISDSETAVTAVTEISVQQETAFISDNYQFYIYAPEDETDGNPAAPTVFDTIPFSQLEIGIDEEHQLVSMLTVSDSCSLPYTGTCFQTDSGYECEINSRKFVLERISETALKFDDKILSLCTDAVQPFAGIQPEDVKSVSVSDTPDRVFSLSSEETNEFMDILRNVKIYYRSLAHDAGNNEISVKLQNSTVYQIVPTQNFLIIDGKIYLADAQSRKTLAEFSRKYHRTDIVTETETETTVPDTDETISVIDPVHLPYVATEGETAPAPDVLPNIQEERPQQLETHYFENVPVQTETVTVPAETDAPDIPESVQNLMYETDNTVFAYQEGPHIALAVMNRFYPENKLSNAMKYYPEKNYQVSVQVFSDLGQDEIIQILQDNGISVQNVRDDGRFLMLLNQEQIAVLRNFENMGFLAELAPEVIPAETPDIPESVRNLMYETDGTVFACQEDPHIEIAVENGFFPENKLTNAMKYYPGKNYQVSVKAFSALAQSEIIQILEDNNIPVQAVRDDGRLLILLNQEKTDTLQNLENIGFLAELAPE